MKNTAWDFVRRFLLFLWAITVLFPILWIVMTSFKTNMEFFEGAWKFPTSLNLENYARAWTQMGIGKSLLNTLYYVGLGVILSVLVTILAAYALARFRFKGRKLIYWGIMISLFLPGVNALVPTYVLLKNLHMNNSLTGLLIFGGLNLNAFLVLILTGFMATIPKEIEESAYIDGASYLITLTKIVVPISKPGIVTVAVYAFLALYNSFLWPYIMLTDSSKFILSVKMYEINQKMQYQSNWVGLCASIVIGLMPSVLFYFSLQKQVQEGMTLGALKA